jgi:uncharacterized membrane-anchored protein
MTQVRNANVDVSLETRLAGLIATAIAIATLVLITVGLNRVAAFVAGLGFLAIMERLHRLFFFFRGQRKLAACIVVACTAVCAFAAVCVVVYLVSPLHAHRAP